jgi:hypothetical protein
MELKEMIAELDRVRQHPCINGDGEEALMSAAEALALVAWAEEHDIDIISRKGGWYAQDGNLGGASYKGDSMLGAIRAAKEAYE